MAEAYEVPAAEDADGAEGDFGHIDMFEHTGPERLYRNAADRDDRRRRLTEQLDPECTFSPQINGRRSVAAGVHVGGSSSPAFERLYAIALARESKGAAAATASGKVDPDCTFKPQLTRKAEELVKRDRAEKRSIYDGLYDQAKVLQDKVEERKRLELLRQGCTFTPKLSRRSAALQRPGTATDRLYKPEWMRNRRLSAHNDPLAAEVEKCTFKPAVTGDKALTQFRRIAKAASGDASPSTEPADAPSSAPRSARGPVFDRLYLSSKVSAADLESARVAVAASQLAECTFKPDLARSKRTAAALGVQPSATAEGAEDPFSRLYNNAVERQERKVKLIEESARATACPFSPEISEVSRRITESMRDSATGDLPRHLLLYEDGLQRQQARTSAEANRAREVTEDDLRNCTFHPMVSHLPVQHVSTLSVHERLYDNARQKQAVLAAATLGVPLEEFPASSAAYGDEEGGEGVGDGEMPEEGEGGAPEDAAAGSGNMYLI